MDEIADPRAIAQTIADLTSTVAGIAEGLGRTNTLLLEQMRSIEAKVDLLAARIEILERDGRERDGRGLQ